MRVCDTLVEPSHAEVCSASILRGYGRFEKKKYHNGGGLAERATLRRERRDQARKGGRGLNLHRRKKKKKKKNKTKKKKKKKKKKQKQKKGSKGLTSEWKTR